MLRAEIFHSVSCLEKHSALGVSVLLYQHVELIAQTLKNASETMDYHVIYKHKA